MSRDYLVCKLHKNGLDIIEPLNGRSAVKLVEKLQRNLVRLGETQTGLTWTVHSGDIVSALVASSHIGGGEQ